MSWNYRVIRRSFISADDTKAYSYAIHEVYYNEDMTIKSWTVDPIDACGEAIKELKECLECMLLACSKPVLEEIFLDGGEEKLVEVKGETE